ncbi:hypothetical protein [Actinoplanes sp. HUAS TT8]|uniref:hypothetical protein n=1 Tax=Actinoplanes sp. HUAS TT8 TaxID=3447453 RepID=UPI003F5287C8
MGFLRQSAPVTVPVPAVTEQVQSGALLKRTGAWLTVTDPASRVQVRTAALPGLLYRVSSASDAGVAPVVTRRGGRVVVRLRATGSDGLDEVRIVLNQDVRWDIRLPAGAGEQQLNLRGGRVGHVELGTSGLAEVWLPEPAGTLPVTFTGGVGTAILTAGGASGCGGIPCRARPAAPFRLRLDRGAGSVVTPWTMNNGTPAGGVLQEDGWRRAADRYEVHAAAGMGSVILRRSGPVRPRTLLHSARS